MPFDDDEGEMDCPLCMEEMDISDRNFKPCPCGYQVCRFCWNHIKENLNARCPACRREYSDKTVEFTPLTPAELTRLRNEKKQKEKEKREMDAYNRRHLSNMRVVQKNLVYVVGISPVVVEEADLREKEYFGQFGKILKLVINRKNATGYTQNEQNLPVGVYITFAKKEDAAKCIMALDGTLFEGRTLRASYGTTKYCSFYLRGLTCQNTSCMYLHEPGEDLDSYTKEEMAMGKHHVKIHPSANPTVTALANAHANNGGVTSGSGPPYNAQIYNDMGIQMGPIAPIGHNYVDMEKKHVEEEPNTVVGTAQSSSPSIIPGTPSALPRTAFWGSKPSHSVSESSAIGSSGDGSYEQGIGRRDSRDQDRIKKGRIECNIFDDIYPLEPMSNSASHLIFKTHSFHKENQIESVINTSMLHRYLHLAQQAREYYLHLSQQLLQSGSGVGDNGVKNSPFSFDPFEDEKRSGVENKESRFGFAKTTGDDAVQNVGDRIEKLDVSSGGSRNYQGW